MSTPEPNELDRTDPAQNATAAQRTINEAVAGLDGLAERPIEEHVARFEAVHTALTDALSSIDKV